MQRPPDLLALPADMIHAAVLLASARRKLGSVTGQSVLEANQKASAAAANIRGLEGSQLKERIAYVIPRIAARVPWRADCLVQALAGQSWLSAQGLASEVRIGAAKPCGEAFSAHAWLVLDGCVLLGGDVSGYSQLLGSEE